MKRVTLTAFDKDSSGFYGETFGIDKDLATNVKEFENSCKFSRFWIEAEIDEEDSLTKQETKWCDKADVWQWTM
jgi:hypothetical protein